MAKVLCVLYDDPVDGYPPDYARDDIPKIEALSRRADAADAEGDRLHARASCSAASPASSACAPTSRRPGHELIVTSDKDGPDSEFERHLADAEVVISQPFWPAYLTAERIAKAPNLKLALTAGIGSDHVDLEAAARGEHHRRRGHLLQLDLASPSTS